MHVQAISSWLVGVALSGALVAGAVAQTPVTPQPSDPQMPSRQNTVPEKVAPSDSTGSTGTLSDKLKDSNGVITPPSNASPDMRVVPPAPGAGTMPIIRPGETTGGAQPK